MNKKIIVFLFIASGLFSGHTYSMDSSSSLDKDVFSDEPCDRLVVSCEESIILGKIYDSIIIKTLMPGGEVNIYFDYQLKHGGEVRISRRLFAEGNMIPSAVFWRELEGKSGTLAVEFKNFDRQKSSREIEFCTSMVDRFVWILNKLNKLNNLKSPVSSVTLQPARFV